MEFASPPMRLLALALLGLAAPPCTGRAQGQSPAASVAPVNAALTRAGAPPQRVSIALYHRHAHVKPYKDRCSRSGGGLVDVAQLAPDTVLITMTGAVVAYSEMRFVVDQCFEVRFDDPNVKGAWLAVEGRVIGLLRGEKQGCAEYSAACAAVASGPVELVGVCVPPHRVCGRDNLSVNEHDGPKMVPVGPGRFTLRQTFILSARTDGRFCKRPSAEFAPEGALDPQWITYFEPFHGVRKDSFGFQVVFKVIPDPGEGSGDEIGGGPVPLPPRRISPSGPDCLRAPPAPRTCKEAGAGPSSSCPRGGTAPGTT